MKKKHRDIDTVRLCQAIRRDRLTTKVYRENYVANVKQYAGHNYSEQGTAERVPVNLLALFVSILGRTLIAKNPRAMLSVFTKQHKPIVSAMQAWANQQIEKMQFENTAARVVTDALFTWGVSKVALATPAESALYGWGQRAGEPLFSHINPEDWVYDTHCRDLSDAAYMGHRIRVPLDVVKDAKYYASSRKSLTPSTQTLYNPEGDERINIIGRSFYGDTDEFEDMVDLWEIYLPRHRVVLTLADDWLTGPEPAKGTEALRQQNWVGPDTGPYPTLRYGLVPGNAWPKAPMMDLVDLHLAANVAYNKLIESVENIKEITLVRGGADADGNRVVNSSNGQMIKCDDPKNIQQVVFSGQMIQQLVAVSTMLNRLFSSMAGNLEMLGGLAAQSGTARQDEMLNENSTRSVADMQQRTVDWTADVIRSLCWFWHHDPFQVQRSLHSLSPGRGNPRVVTPQMRQQIRFEDMDIRVDPYSLQHQTPQARMGMLDQVMKEIFIPLAPLLQQQGIMTDFNAYLEKKAKYGDMPDLTEIATIQDPPTDQQGGGGAEQPRMPVQTSREYIRKSLPGRTQKGDDQNLINSSLGIDTGGASRNGQPQTVGA